MAKISKIKGVADLFEPQAGVYTRMENTAREVFSRYGYMEVRIPVMEKTELFARSIGEETDVVQKEMYTFEDRKGRSLTLRPEATAGVLRAYIENPGLSVQGGLSKLFTFGPMFRYERPQKGRMRQFHQIDAELIGADRPEADAELVLMLWTYLRELGLRQLTFEINSLGCRECRPAYRQALSDYFESLDKAALCEDCLRRSGTNPLRVLDCKVPGCREAVKDAPPMAEGLCGKCAEDYARVKRLLDEAGVEYEENHRLVRGLDYYVGLTFEVTSGDIGAQTAVAGGGRYDGLLADLGGKDEPATGFAIGMERLAMLLAESEPKKLDFYLALLDESARSRTVGLAQGLREAGLAGETDFEAGSLKSRLRAANRKGARFCLLLGKDEIDKGELTVKDLESGEQWAEKPETAADTLCERLKSN
jgi:histidyl-tRNA synthetase